MLQKDLLIEFKLPTFFSCIILIEREKQHEIAGEYASGYIGFMNILLNAMPSD